MVLKRKPTNKEVLVFTYPCYICGSILGKARQAINHVDAVHGYKLPVRAVGHRRPPDVQYEYNNNPSSTDTYDLSHYACSSCWFHCPEAGLKELSDHINTVHHPENIDPTKNENGEIKGGEVSDIDKNAALTKAREAEDMSDEDDTENEEDEDMLDTDDQPQATGESKRSMADIYQKLNELSDMFQKLLKGKEETS